MLPEAMDSGSCYADHVFRGPEGDIEKGYQPVRRSRGASTSSNEFPTADESIEPTTWMACLDDETPLSGLTIPGTHDSTAYTYAFPFVQTQKLNILNQLNAGIRYFDFRCGLRDNIVEMVHGPTLLGLRLDDILHTIYLWLGKFKSEALIVQIKQDRRSERSTMRFASAISDIVAKGSKHWRTENTPCTLGQLRGRIQLFRRFTGPPFWTFGVNVTEWKDNPTTPFTIHTCHDVQITVQDHYNPPQGTTLPALIRQKGGNVSELLGLASNDENLDHWFINFTSAYEFDLLNQINPHQVAVGGYWRFHWEHGINVRLRSYLREQGKEKKRFGIIAIDFPEQGADDLIAALILKNFDRTQTRAGTFVMKYCMFLVLILALYWAICTRRWGDVGIPAEWLLCCGCSKQTLPLADLGRFSQRLGTKI